jgi:hypothetical protein
MEVDAHTSRLIRETKDSIPGRDLQQIIADAIYEGLSRQEARDAANFVGMLPHPRQKTSIEGDFYLMTVARRVVRRLEESGHLKI